MIKKIIVVALSISMLSILPINAESREVRNTSKNSSFYQDGSLTITRYEEPKLELYSNTPELIATASYTGESGEEIRMEVFENVIYFYATDGSLIAISEKLNSKNRSALYGNNYTQRLSYGHTDNKGSRWSDWYFTGDEDWVIKEIKNYTTDKVKDLIIGTLIGGGIPGYIYMTYSIASDFADLITKKSSWLNEIYFGLAFYGSTNGECDSLVWYSKVPTVLTGPDNAKYFTIPNYGALKENPKYTWNNNPNDYTLPSSCRVIANTYPAN